MNILHLFRAFAHIVLNVVEFVSAMRSLRRMRRHRYA